MNLLARSFGLNACPYFDGGGGGIRTPVRNGFGRTSTRVVNLWSRGRYADSRAYPSASVRLYESQTRERSAPSQVLLDEASPPSRRPRVGRWPSVRPPGRNRCSQLLFSLFFNEANRGPRRAIRSPRIPSKPNHPQWGSGDSIPQIPRAVWKNRQGRDGAVQHGASISRFGSSPPCGAWPARGDGRRSRARARPRRPIRPGGRSAASAHGPRRCRTSRARG